MNFTQAAAELHSGRTINLRPSGHSMTPIIHHRQQVTISPVPDDAPLKAGALVLVKVRGTWLLHRIGKVGDDQFQIAHARGKVNGWVRRQAIAGIVTRIDSQ